MMQPYRDKYFANYARVRRFSTSRGAMHDFVFAIYWSTQNTKSVANSHQGEHEAQVGAADVVGYSFHELSDSHAWHGGRVEDRVLARLKVGIIAAG